MWFGTDGIRGIVDKELTTELAYKVGKGIALLIQNRGLEKEVIIGCDTRVSSDTFVSAIASGLSDYGINCVIVGIVSTPIISFLVSRMTFGAGIMITASHNDYKYNGIKVFASNGEKLDTIDESLIEEYAMQKHEKILNKGKIFYKPYLIEYYTNYLYDNFDMDLMNMTIVIDCANGSNYDIAPSVLKNFNANIIKLSCNNDGMNINNNCGANHIDNLLSEVKSHNADVGLAFDGDGDRLRVVIGENVLSGDELLVVFAKYFMKQNKLKKLKVVGTIMSNMGIEKYLKENGITLLRTDVGDKNVISLIKNESLLLGGESSGHICIYEHNPTCDALLNALLFLKIFVNEFDEFSVFNINKIMYPCIIKNISVSSEFRKSFDENLKLKKSIATISARYPKARIVLRPSGTEPVIRIYVESVSEVQNDVIIKKLENLLKKYSF